MDNLLPILGFVLVTTATPGPNNLMLMASGANAGFRRSLPHIAGILAGCQIMLLLLALGLGQLLLLHPPAMAALRVGGAAFMVHLAWRLARAHRHTLQSGKGAQPLSFWQAVLFQWVNPKAWMMMLTALATFTEPVRFTASVTVLALSFLLLGAPLISGWNLFGAALQGWLSDGRRLRRFNLAMASVLLASLYPVFFLH